jgi:hypothetical protein
MKFKEWFYTEQGTFTASIAMFARPIFGGDLVGRTFPDCIGNGDKEHKHKKKKHRKKEEWNLDN